MAKKEKNPPAEEQEVEGGGEGGEGAPKKKGGKLKLIIIVVLAMAIGGGGAFAAMMFLGGSKAPETAAVEGGDTAPPPPAPGDDTAAPIEDPKKGGAEAASGGAAVGEGGEGEGVEALGPQNIEFKPFIVNLNDGAGRRFLKLTMSIEAENPDLANEINLKMPQFRDTILLLLSSLSFDDIATLDGKMRLRNQMLNRINTQLTSGKIRNIYFSEFVVQ
ncbi:flagellar basal body protein FliL [Deltaproteobacteria bacterium Smac51]|nr:flagellar basal body protein FliL [Deltaproteobacteria bacterium Smac51]